MADWIDELGRLFNALQPALTPFATLAGAVWVAQKASQTTRQVTGDLERQKLDMTERMEKQKLDLTERLEKQRLEASESADFQKQRMELYKTIYQERILVFKTLMEIAGGYYHKSLIYRKEEMDAESFSPNPEAKPQVTYEEMEQFSGELLTCLRMNHWLIKDEVYDKGVIFGRRGRAFFDPESPQYPVADGGKAFAEARNDLSEAVSIMMLRYDVSEIAFPSK